MENLVIRISTKADLPKMVEIYNQAIQSGTATGDIEILETNDRIDWFNEHNPEKYPIIVAELDNVVVGYLSLSPYRKGRGGLRFTSEISYYIDYNHHKKSIGSMLMQEGLKRAKEIGFRVLVAILFDINIGSIKLLEKHGFAKWGHLPNVMDINGSIYGHVYYGKEL